MNGSQSTKVFYRLLANALIASVTNAFVWFALTYWVFLETKSVLSTSIIAGVFAVSHAVSAMFFGSVVDHSRKRSAMILSSVISCVAYCLGAVLYFLTDPTEFSDRSSILLWCLVVVLMLGSVAGNLRSIALSTTVTLLFPEGRRDRANGLIGTMHGISFSLTSILSGLVIGFLGMGVAIGSAVLATLITLIHLFSMQIPGDKISHTVDSPKKMDLRGTIAVVALIPGLFGLIFFTTFNNFLGGVFMALMDAYGLFLVSVQTWGFLWGALSLAFIAGGFLIARYGLGSNPLRTLFSINIITWTVCVFFAIQPSIVLLALGMFIWLLLIPFVEAAEHTVIQKVVPYERQGRVFGFAQSVESAASPLTAFFIGPIAELVFIPFMTTGVGVTLIGHWFGVGPDRGIALVFILAGFIGLTVTLIARFSRSYRVLSDQYTIVSTAEPILPVSSEAR